MSGSGQSQNEPRRSESQEESAKCFVDPSSKFYQYVDINTSKPNPKYYPIKLDPFRSDEVREESYPGVVYEVESKVPIGSMEKGVVHANSILIHPENGYVYILDVKCIRIQVFDPILNYAFTIQLRKFSERLTGIRASQSFCFFNNFICVVQSHPDSFFVYVLTQSGNPVTLFNTPCEYDYYVKTILSFEDCLYIPFYRYMRGMDLEDSARNYSLQSNFTAHTLHLHCMDRLGATAVKLSGKFWPFCQYSYTAARFQNRSFYIAACYSDAVNLNIVPFVLEFSIDSLELITAIPLQRGLISHFSTAGFIFDAVSNSFWFCDIDTNRLLIFSKTGEFVIGLEREGISSTNEYHLISAPLAINHISKTLIVSIPGGNNYCKLIDLKALREEISDNT